jgi:hypothetical protein
MSHCSRRHSFGTKSFLCNAHDFCIAYSDIGLYLNYTYRTHCCISIATMVKRRCHNINLTCSAYLVRLAGPQNISLYLSEIETACQATFEFLKAMVMNKRSYTTNRRVQLLWNSSVAALHMCKPISRTNLSHARLVMESLGIKRLSSHCGWVV